MSNHIENYKYRHWKCEEIPVGAAIRIKGTGKVGIITKVRNYNDEEFESTLYSGVCSCEFALEDLEFSTDFGHTWFPCGILEN